MDYPVLAAVGIGYRETAYLLILNFQRIVVRVVCGERFVRPEIGTRHIGRVVHNEYPHEYYEIDEHDDTDQGVFYDLLYRDFFPVFILRRLLRIVIVFHSFVPPSHGQSVILYILSYFFVYFKIFDKRDLKYFDYCVKIL